MSAYEDALEESDAQEPSAEDVAWHVKAYSECGECEGFGFFSYEPPGWWHGSGVMTEEAACGACDGTGLSCL